MRPRSQHWEPTNHGETIPALRLAEAAVLIARLHGGDRTEAESVRRWLRADAMNAAAFALATEVWEESEDLHRMVAPVHRRVQKVDDRH